LAEAVLAATGALEESAGADGEAVEEPAIVSVGDEGAGDAAGGAKSAIVDAVESVPTCQTSIAFPVVAWSKPESQLQRLQQCAPQNWSQQCALQD